MYFPNAKCNIQEFFVNFSSFQEALNTTNFSYILGFTLNETDLYAAAEQGGVLNAPKDYIRTEICSKLENILPEPENVKPNEFVQAYLSIKYSELKLQESTQWTIDNGKHNILRL